jgi:hypothetical protein
MTVVAVMLATVVNLAVCDQARVDKRTWESARKETIRIMEAAGMKVNWIDLDDKTRDCFPKRDLPEHAVSIIVTRGAPKNWTNNIDAMGMAVPPARAYIYFQVVRKVAKDFGNDAPIETGVVLGHGIAHELGHLLMSGEAHGNGIMSARWTRTDWQSMGTGSLLFVKEHAERMRRELEARTSVAAGR